MKAFISKNDPRGRVAVFLHVSCTEEGRWSYNSPEFYDMGSVASHSLRSLKRCSVSKSLV